MLGLLTDEHPVMVTLPHTSDLSVSVFFLLCQSIIFGLPNSGQVFPYSIFKLDASNARDSFFYNVGFGVEGTAFAIIILAAACVVIIVPGQLKVLKRPEIINSLI